MLLLRATIRRQTSGKNLGKSIPVQGHQCNKSCPALRIPECIPTTGLLNTNTSSGSTSHRSSSAAFNPTFSPMPLVSIISIIHYYLLRMHGSGDVGRTTPYMGIHPGCEDEGNCHGIPISCKSQLDLNVENRIVPITTIHKALLRHISNSWVPTNMVNLNTIVFKRTAGQQAVPGLVLARRQK